MLIDDIVSKLDEGGPKSYYSFETFILHLLKHHLQQQGKTLLIKTDQFYPGDAVAPEGFDEYEGPTLFDIKFNLGKISPKAWIERLLHGLLKTQPEIPFTNLIIVSAKPIPQKIRETAPSDIGWFSPNCRIHFWGPEEVNKIVNQNRAKANEVVKNLFALRLEAAVSNPTHDWKNERSKIVEKLKDSYDRGQFSLFLGAGVSSSAGMPDWNTLLNSLFVAYLTREFDGDSAISDSDIAELVGRLNRVSEPSALMAARYLRRGLVRNGEEAKEFVTAITKSLYDLRNKKYDTDSRLLQAISATCMPRRTGAKVRSVVTYNFDDLLEKQLNQKNILYRCVYTEGEVYDPDELPIYHVHGFLPENRKKYNWLEKSTLVFSEEGYHHIYTNAYHWSNLVQLNCLRENNCLMIGLSMTDPNLRRLLDISARSLEHSKHYAFMKRLTKDSFCYDSPQSQLKPAVANVEGAKKFLDRHHVLNEQLMKELGVTIIWYENYDDIPEILEQLTQ